MNHIEASKQSYNRTIEEQGRKGIETYGQPMNPMEPGRDWLDMAEQELVDGHQYIVAERIKREKIISDIREYIDDELRPFGRAYINGLLDVLEGK